MKEHSITLEGRKYQYYLYGQGTKTLVILHGMTDCKEIAYTQFTPLTKRYRCLILDLPGHNNLPLGDIKSTAEIGEYVLKLLDHLQLKDYALIGFSLGSIVALSMSLSCPSRVPLLLYASPVVGESFLIRLAMFCFRHTPRWLYVSELHSHFARFVLWFLGHRQPPKRMDAKTKVDMAIFWKLGLRADDSCLYTRNPKLFIFGTNDHAIPDSAAAKLKAKKPKNATIKVVQDGGHFATKEGHREAMALMDEFLKKHLK